MDSDNVALWEVREDAEGNLYLYELASRPGFSAFLASHYPDTPTQATPEKALTIYIAKQEAIKTEADARIVKARALLEEGEHKA